MHIFNYSFLEEGMLPASIVNVTSAISAFNAISGERKGGNLKAYTELESLARIQSVKNSNAIEGIVTTDLRIKEIVNGNSEPLNHNEMEIAGYRDALDRIHTHHRNLKFSEDMIKQLHKDIQGQVDFGSGGHYKQEDNLIMSINELGRRTVRFIPVPASETKDAMEQLVLAYMEARSNPRINQLLLIPCVVLDFLCIHPFADGNGRVSRLLSLLLMYKSGFDIGKYVSFEEQINETKELYYEALYDSSQQWHENMNSYVPFMENFLMTLYLCYKELDKRFSIVNGKMLKKNERVEQTVLNSVLPISKAEICDILPDISVTTVEAVLCKLVKEEKVKRIGQARNTKYVNAEYID